MGILFGFFGLCFLLWEFPFPKDSFVFWCSFSLIFRSPMLHAYIEQIRLSPVGKLGINKPNRVRIDSPVPVLWPRARGRGNSYLRQSTFSDVMGSGNGSFLSFSLLVPFSFFFFYI